MSCKRVLLSVISRRFHAGYSVHLFRPVTEILCPVITVDEENAGGSTTPKIVRGEGVTAESMVLLRFVSASAASSQDYS